MNYIKGLALALTVVVLQACGGIPLQSSSQEASLSGGSTVTATDVQELSSTNTQVSTQDTVQESTQGSRVQAESVDRVETQIVTNNGIVLSLPILLGGLFIVLILGWLIPAPPWFRLIFRGKL